MPELPEVVTVTNILNEELIGLKIEYCEVFWPKLLTHQTADELSKRVKNQTIQRVFNKGKFIIFELTKDVLISHLRMEGRWAFERKENHSYSETILEAEFGFSNAEDKVLRYYDFRRFGTLEIANKETYLKSNSLAKVGPEANEPHLKPNWLKERLAKTRRPIKVVLLDQTIISGIGNIYDNEILFAAQINPYTPANKLTYEQVELILVHARLILNKAIIKKGTTIHTFESRKGQTGQYQNYLKVHGKNNQPCPQCQTTIIKEAIGGRGTYYCPKCQS
ncbi:DNA-(apurinic or apyrimidinic site) lyase [Entomoplasma freundtii]|uniref:Formamidopyrimidine-DNA glycosylase n=1 Tax=Entomoplasma freundtii TaxID=74700 RepID=A0A2K8NUZ3_9MOLU|nr:DNA-formamidopyrimidine glycosylase [Entomoplasma freundtii]ATZ16453.1 formamidopyrimidine-DNA glycosylase [Entomoplasma freundtii]TDY55983.1 DNA-(apurinic or apyrimidinic site) lyase [Entomoplasma freundtii]